MKKRLLLIPLLIMGFFSSYGQICSINYSVNSPGVYPNELEDATIGVPFNQEVTLLFPSELGYTSVQIKKVILPLGMTWQCSEETNDCTYNPGEDPFACINMFGTPAFGISIGNMNIDIVSEATKADGQTEEVVFTATLNVLPSTPSNGVFTANQSFLCESGTVSFSVDNPINYTPIPNQTQGILHFWNFGNGNSSTSEQPVEQTYSGEGEYAISYSQIIDTIGFVLKKVTVTNVGCTDAVFYGEPDIYIQVIDGNGTKVYNSGVSDATLPISYNVNIPLITPPYSINVMDDDDDNLIGTDHDNCVNGDEYDYPVILSLPLINSYGTTIQTASEGSLVFNYEIVKDTTEIHAYGIVNVYNNPSSPVLIADYNVSPILLSTPDNSHIYNWFLEDEPLYHKKATTIQPVEAGIYTVTAINEHGCYSTSSPEIVDFLNIDEAQDGIIFNIYPNPANSMVTLNFLGTTDNLQVNLLDLSGRNIMMKEVNGKPTLQLDVSHLSRGIYSLKVKNSRRNFTKKLIIN